MSETFPSFEMVEHIKAWYRVNPITRAMQDDEQHAAAEIAAAQLLAYLSDPTNVEDAKAWAEATMQRGNSYGLLGGTTYRVRGQA